MYIQPLTALLAAALLLGSCTTQDDNRPQTLGEPASLSVQVNVAPQTRNAVTGTAFSHSSRINIILQDAGVTAKYQGISQPYEFQKQTDSDPGAWVPTEAEGLKVSDPAEVYAHYPAVLTASEATLSSDKKTLTVALPASRDFGDINTSSTFESFFLAVNKSTPGEAKEVFICADDADYMAGRGTQVSTVVGESKATTISMKHLMAMVVVYVKRNAALPDNPDVKRISISNTTGGPSPLKQGAFSMTDNTFTPNTTAAVYTRTMSGFPVDQVYYAMMVYPSVMAEGDVQMELVADQTTYTMEMPAKTWLAGHVYLYNVEISTNTAQLKGVSVEEWPAWIDKPFELE